MNWYVAGCWIPTDWSEKPRVLVEMMEMATKATLETSLEISLPSETLTAIVKESVVGFSRRSSRQHDGHALEKVT